MVSESIEKLVTGYKQVWWSTPTCFPDLGEPLDSERKASSERECEALVREAISEMKRFDPEDTEGRSLMGQNLKRILTEVGKILGGFSDSDMELLFGSGFICAASDFSDEARRFKENTTIEDVMQAIRNVWIANCIQLLKGLDIRLTPSIFGYSMLYPYTDNVLDATEQDMAAKKAFCSIFRLILEGRPAVMDDPYRKGLKSLVGHIEGEYPRNFYPEVYQSLLDIHDAQVESLVQQSSGTSPYETDILGISFAKGGTSVQADAYLAMGELTGEEKDFIFGFGIFLQLADDLQDTLTDRQHGHMTIFSQTAGKWPLDSITNRMFNFCRHILKKSRCFNSIFSKQLLGIMEKSFWLLILHAVSDNTGMYTPEYVKRLEAYSPLSFKYVRKLERKIQSEYGSLTRKSKGRAIDSDILKTLAETDRQLRSAVV